MSKEGRIIKVEKENLVKKRGLYIETEKLVKQVVGEVSRSGGLVHFMDNEVRAEKIRNNLFVLKNFSERGVSCVEEIPFVNQKVFILSNFVRSGGKINDELYRLVFKSGNYDDIDFITLEIRKAILDRTQKKNISKEEKNFLMDQWFKLNGQEKKNNY
jgi:hypothetical protein